jgi:type IV pilus assembly protein PilP
VKRKMKKNKIITFCNLIILFTAAFYAFCAEAVNPSPQTPPSKPVPAQLETKTPSLPPVLQTPDNVYSYNPLGKPDPFKPFVDVEIAAMKKDKESKVDSIFPLQRAEVESFKLIGIVGDQARRVAVVEDSAKKFYPLFIGTRIGLHGGKVIDILADRVTVDELDGKKAKRIILKLRKNI